MRGMVGLRGQSMRAGRVATAPALASFPPGSYAWKVPAAGVYRVAVWGGAVPLRNNQGLPNTGGASGSFWLVERPLAAGMVLPVVVGGIGGASSVTLPGGVVITAGAGYYADPGGGQVWYAGVPTMTGAAPYPSDVQLSGSLGGGPGQNGFPGAGSGGGPGGTGSPSGPQLSGGAGAPGWGDFRGGAGAHAGGSPGSPGGGAAQTSTGEGPGSHGLVIIQQIRGV